MNLPKLGYDRERMKDALNWVSDEDVIRSLEQKTTFELHAILCNYEEQLNLYKEALNELQELNRHSSSAESQN